MLCELHALHALPPDVPILLCDNKSALFLSHNPISYKQTKHNDIDYYFIRQLDASVRLHSWFIPTHLQLAKSLPRPLFEHFCDKFRVGINDNI